MPNFELPFPFGGLNDNTAQSKQPSGTTSDAVNVRGVDPQSGRVRGAQRSGLSKYTNESFEERVKRFEKVVYDNRQLSYGIQDPPKLVWEETNANNNASTYGVVDSRENLYVVDAGRAVQKFNKNGVLIYTITPNIEDQNLHIRGLAVDGNGNLWIATGHQNPAQLSISPSPLTSAVSIGKSKIWRYQENETGAAPEQVYAFSPNLAVEKLVYKNGLLYAAANDPKLEEGYAVVYGDLFTTGLEEFSRRKLPYPLCDIDVDNSAKVYFASAGNKLRYERHSATYPYYGQTIVDWTPSDIPVENLWSWFDATKIVAANNERVTAWEDSSGNSRDLACNPISEFGPKYKESGWLGLPCLEFDGASQLYSTPAAQPTTSTSQGSSRSALPNYTGAKWAMFIAFRPLVGTESAPIANPMFLFGQNTSSTETSDISVAIHKAQNLAIPGSVAENKVNLFATADSSPSWAWALTGGNPSDNQPSPRLYKGGPALADIGAGAYKLPASGTLNANNNASILTIIYTGDELADGAISNDALLHCSFHLNGQPIDRWRGMQQVASAAFYLGRPSNAISNTNIWFKGEVAEIVTVHNLDVSFDRGYPRTLGLACKAQPFTLGDISGGGASFANFGNAYDSTSSVSPLYWQSFANDSATVRAQLLASGGNVIYRTAGTGSHFAVLTAQSGDNKYVCHQSDEIPLNVSYDLNPVALNSAAKSFNASVNNSNANLCEKIEGYLAWKWGIWPLLPRGNHVAPNLAANTTYNPGNWPHPYRSAPPSPDSTLTQSRYAKFVSPLPVTGCLESITGELRWITDGFSGDASGTGLRIKHVNDSVYTMGNSQFADSTADGQYSWSDFDGQIRKLTYSAATQQISTEWKLGAGAAKTFLDDYLPHLAADSFDNLYLPFRFDGSDALQDGWSVYAKDSTPSPINLVNSNSSASLHAVPEVVSPPYRIGNLAADDFPGTPNPANPDTYPRAENVYVLRDSGGDDTTVERYELIETQADPALTSPRAQTLLAVSAGKIKKVDAVAGIQSPAGIGTLTQPELDSNSTYIDSAVLFGKVYFADGRNYRVYDPRNDIVQPWEAQDSGSLPSRCKLLANWRGRAVLARGADDPHNWHMSEQGAPNNWDYFPPVTIATQAVSGNNARAGLCPDLVNSLIPYNDDLMLFGCDSSLWMMRGDPMAGGVFDLVTDITGVSFGRPWAKDPEGTLYFFGSRGGVYMMKPGGIPISMTQATIERRLTNVNLGQFYVEMFWNTFDDGLHLFMLPFTDTTTHTKHYFWERRTGAWFEDQFAPEPAGLNRFKQPSAAIVVDGDAPNDRCLLLGTYDKSLVKWDRSATSDDGEIIGSRVLIGPIAPDDSSFDARISNLAAVMAQQGAVSYRLYASQTPDDKGVPVASGVLQPGRNPVHLVRAKGAFVWLELGGANNGTRWAVESMRMDAYPAGRKRNA